MGNLNHRNAAFEIVPWAAPASQGEFGLGDLVGRIGRGMGDVAGRVIDTVRGAGIIDLTAQADKSGRKRPRDLKKVRALVLHQMACCHRRKDPLKDYLRLKAHFAILPDGRILQIHPVRDLIWASNGFNTCSVAVEFAGNFPNTKGKWWEGDKFGRNQVTPAQIEAGRRLVRHLVGTIGLRTILAHRQSIATRENDPGPDIWYHVGQWAVDNLDLKDGGPGFKVGDGKPIPDLWRTWGRVRPAVPVREAGFGEAEQEVVVFGPLTVTLCWEGPFTRKDALAKGKAKGQEWGGVYIAYCEPLSLSSILKVGKASTFSRRMGDYSSWKPCGEPSSKQITPSSGPPSASLMPRRTPPPRSSSRTPLPKAQRTRPPEPEEDERLRFFLAEVHGFRPGRRGIGSRGIGGVVEMVEFALTRLLLKAGYPLPEKTFLLHSELLRKPSRALGDVSVTNVLPPALLKAQLRLPPEVTSGNLVLKAGSQWEAEQFPQG